MVIHISKTPSALGQVAGAAAADCIRKALAERGEANVILATGTSQFETLNQLLHEPDIDWMKVTMFHLDEYIALPESHPASFRKYLKERVLSRVVMKESFLINGETQPETECERLGKLILQHPIDVALVGIGENGHLAFNDPPADFETESPYIVVNLDEACRRQQLGEGWFATLDDVPQQAISMSIRQIMKSAALICSVPDERKAEAVKNCLTGEISPLFPASILQNHPNCGMYLDKASSKYLS